MNHEEFDYLIVGGGSAGCVLAARLSEDSDTRVLLLEAGARDWHPFIHMPLGVGQIRQANLYDWGYRSEPQAHLNGRRIELRRGKVLGGSSSVNFMAHNRGNRSDYDRWVRMGTPQWSYDKLLPYFKRLESWREGHADHRGQDGPIGITYTCKTDPLGDAVLQAAQAAGFPIFDDLNDEEPHGFGLAQSAIDRGRRASSANGYLRPIKGRKNLTVRTKAQATRVLFEGNKAIGLEYRWQGMTRQVRSAREVILSSGAINTPHLLMLSGVGDAEELRTHGIRPVQHSPNVGKRLQDHLMVPVNFRRIGPESPLHRMLRIDRVIPALLSAILAGKGPATVLPSGVNSILRTRAELDAPDIQIIFGAGALEARPWVPGLNDWPDLFYLRPVGAHPESRGRIWLESSDPAVKPRIDPCYLSEPSDIRALRDGFRIVRDIVSQTPLDTFRGEELLPGPKCGNSDEEIDAHIRATATTVQHLSCTCAASEDTSAVVDSHLLVRGVESLRVVDASVMPEVLSCNINAAVLAIAEWASDVIRGRALPTGPQP